MTNNDKTFVCDAMNYFMFNNNLIMSENFRYKVMEYHLT